MYVTLEGTITDVEEFSLLADVSKFTSYVTSKLAGAKVRCTVMAQDTNPLIVIEKIA